MPDNGSTLPTVLEPPVMAGGDCARLVSVDGVVRVEVWRPSGWRLATGAPDVAEVVDAPPASSRTLDRLGVPPGDRGPIDPETSPSSSAPPNTSENASRGDGGV